jgi:predicted metal-dependent hydrolase
MAESKESFRRRVRVWSARLNVTPSSVRIQRMTRKWASCSASGTVSFASDLLAKSAAFRDYVIVHELLHLRVANHGKLFKALLGLHIPDWRRIERQLHATPQAPLRRAA